MGATPRDVSWVCIGERTMFDACEVKSEVKLR